MLEIKITKSGHYTSVPIFIRLVKIKMTDFEHIPSFAYAYIFTMHLIISNFKINRLIKIDSNVVQQMTCIMTSVQYDIRS